MIHRLGVVGVGDEGVDDVFDYIRLVPRGNAHGKHFGGSRAHLLEIDSGIIRLPAVDARAEGHDVPNGVIYAAEEKNKNCERAEPHDERLQIHTHLSSNIFQGPYCEE